MSVDDPSQRWTDDDDRAVLEAFDDTQNVDTGGPLSGRCIGSLAR